MSDAKPTDPPPMKWGFLKQNPLAFVSFFVAALSLVTSFYQGYLNTKFVELVQSGVSRSETAHTCKELIDAYFQIKLKVANLSAAAEKDRSANLFQFESDVANAVSRFAALGTYLANFQGEEKRAKYSALSAEVKSISGMSRTTPPPAVDKLFEKADSMFSEMNNDCVASINRRI